MSVNVKELSKRFGGRREVLGVDRVSFECPEHRITSLLGPSGSGKSTLLRLVAGLEIPDGGAVFINGDEVTQVPVRERNVGFVFQNYALFSHMSVFENIAFGLKVRGAPASDIRARVSELLSLVQLQGYERRLPDQLSGGQRQRIALARALAIRPRVLLLDEPFGALDTQVRVELREWLHQLHEQTQVTTLLVTHDQEEALELSDHIVLLKDHDRASGGWTGTFRRRRPHRFGGPSRRLNRGGLHPSTRCAARQSKRRHGRKGGTRRTAGASRKLCEACGGIARRGPSLGPNAKR